MKKWLIGWAFLVLFGLGINVYAKSTYINPIDYNNLRETAADCYVIKGFCYSAENEENSLALFGAEPDDIVAKVQAKGNCRGIYMGSLVDIQVLEVYQGDSSFQGKEATLITGAYVLVDINGRQVNSKVNFMEEGRDYLISMKHREMPKSFGKKLYFTTAYNYNYVSWFLLGDKPDMVPAKLESSNYCRYREVSDNEVLAMNQADIDSFHQLKKILIEKFTA